MMAKRKAKPTPAKRRTVFLVWRMRNGRPEFRGLHSPERTRAIVGAPSPSGWQATPIAMERRR
jgi:hypothetical protein